MTTEYCSIGTYKNCPGTCKQGTYKLKDRMGYQFTIYTDRINSNNIIYNSKIYEYGIFYGCTNLKKVNIPTSVTCISPTSFFGCSSLREINLHEGITTISVWAFCGCKSLERVDIPKSVENIYFGAFGGCSNLKEVNITNRFTKVDETAFEGCTGLF